MFQLRGPEGAKPFDVFVLARAHGLEGNETIFWSLPDGELVVDEKGTANASALADAVEKKLSRPYKAVATRQTDDLWSVGAIAIEVARIVFEGGDFLALGHDEVNAFAVDGEPSSARIPRELEEVGERHAPHYYVEASRIDGDIWEVRVSKL
jgi:hypothetical protein